MKKIVNTIRIPLIVFLFFSATIVFSFSEETETDKEIYMKFGNTLESPPFQLRKDYYDETGKSWRYLIYDERKKYFDNWLEKNPEYLNDEKKDVDPALLQPPTSIQKKFGLYLENAPFDARSDFYNTTGKSWGDTEYPEKATFLKEWLSINRVKKQIDESQISDEVKDVLTQIHEKYGKELYNAPFDARVEYFQTYNQSWREAEYIDRKNFILEWYAINQEKLEKFKAQLKAELDAKFQNELESMKMVDLEIPSSFGNELKDVPFELKRQYHIDTGGSWGDTSVDIREVYAKKWLIENKDVYTAEIERSRRVFEHNIEVLENLEKFKEEKDLYREEIERRRLKREKEAEKKKKEEQDRRDEFKKRVENQRKKLERLIREREREKKNN